MDVQQHEKEDDDDGRGSGPLSPTADDVDGLGKLKKFLGMEKKGKEPKTQEDSQQDTAGASSTSIVTVTDEDSWMDLDIDARYDMMHKHRGTFLIINNVEFKHHKPRLGSDLDADRLAECFKKLGFDVKRYNNLTASKMNSTVVEEAKSDHSSHDCFGLAILSHGSEGKVEGRDGPIVLQTLLQHLKMPGLRGKPKIVIIQACRGEKLDEGTNVKNHPETTDVKTEILQVDSDIICAYASPPGRKAHRNTKKGSSFIKNLADTLEARGTSEEFMRLLAEVCSLECDETKKIKMKDDEGDEFTFSAKTIPCITSQLTKQLYFQKKH